MIFKIAPSTESKKFLRLKDKDSVTGVFRGDPYDFRTHWIGKKTSPCTGDQCSLCKENSKSVFKFRINFITKDPDTQKYTAKIFEQGWKMYGTLQGLQTAGYELETTILQITRQGSDTNTVYSVVPVKNSDLTAEKKAIIDAVPLHDLVNLEQEPEVNHAPDFSDEVPF